MLFLFLIITSTITVFAEFSQNPQLSNLADNTALDLGAYDCGARTGWTLWSATGISADATTIVGYGANPSGQTEAWLANISVPEPSTFALISFATTTIVSCRRRHRRLLGSVKTPM